MAIIHDLINPEVRERDVKLAAFGLVVVVMTIKLALSQIDPEWTRAFYGLAALVGLGGPALIAAERWHLPTPPPQDGPSR